ncbi:MAG: hypothetical protein IKK33_15955 [Lachnospiraceae bacterium]|nr:hypothetical protein [Lachnospiraceae bacterium]
MRKIKGIGFLIISFVLCLGMFLLTGCGGGSCETVQCANISAGNDKVIALSIPGCGGCLTPGKGCLGSFWSQSVKIIAITESEDDAVGVACDNQYYDGGCSGCLQNKQSCYSGIVIEDSGKVGVFCGSTESDKVCGISDGCGGCIASDGSEIDSIRYMEEILGID